MWANNIIAAAVKILSIPLTVVALGTTFLGGLIMAIPLVGLTFVLMISIIWLPLFGLLLGSAWVWHYAPSGIRSLATIIGVPLAMLANTFITLMPGGAEMFAKMVKQVMCQDWPYAYTDRDGKPLIQTLREEEHLTFPGAIIRWCDMRTERQVGRPSPY